MNISLIGKDSPHRRFIINKLIDLGFCLDTCIFLDEGVIPKFDVRSPWVTHEETELVNFYEKETRSDLDRVRKIITLGKLDHHNHEVSQALNAAEVVIVSGADWIKGEILDLIANKSFNVHMGIAEEYRGLDSNLWAWYHKDYNNIGVSLHKLALQLDAGSLFQVGYINISKNIKVWELRYYEASLAVKLIEATLKDIKSNNVTLKLQRKLGRYYSFMPNDLKKLLPITPKFENM